MLLQEQLTDAWGTPWHLTDLSASARILTESHSLIAGKPRVDPDLAIIHHGITEAIIRPSPRALRYLPPRWRKPGWMDPRPYFSVRPIRRLLQVIESGLRWRTKVAMIRAGASMRYLSPQTYAEGLTGLLTDLTESHSSLVIIISHCGISERHFPGSTESLEAFYRATIQAVQTHPHCHQVAIVDVRDLASDTTLMLADGFHPSAAGHRVIANRAFSAYMTLPAHKYPR